MVRVLHIVSLMNRGGLETFIMNIYRKIDRNKVQFDFLVTREEKGLYDDEIYSLGGKIYNIPHISKVGHFKYKRIVKDFFISHPEYSIVHCHMNTWSGLFLPIAKHCNIPVRIAHSHSTKNSSKGLGGYLGMLYKNYNKLFIKGAATHLFACGYDAGKWLYGENAADTEVTIINNGIDTCKFKYNQEIAKRVRKDLGISEDTFVIGHVGRFSLPKNHSFLIDIFKEILKKSSDTVLCLVGDGVLRNSIENQVMNEGMNDNVKFLGVRDDVNELMMAFDVFLFPSLYEGFPVVVVEAQAATLPCILSDNITKDVDMGMGLVDFVSLEKSPKYWAEVVFNAYYKDIDRNMSIDKLIELGYDSQSTANWLEKFYIKNIVDGEEFN